MNAKTAVRSNLLPSLLYFFYFAASGCITPFLNIFFQAKGISIAQISILGAMPMGLTLVAAPIWAGIADYFGLHRKILPLIIFLTMPFVALMGSANSFFFLLPAIIFYGLCNSPIMSLSDNSVLSYMGANRHNYGHVRLWGSISWGLMGWLSGILVERLGPTAAYVGFMVFMSLEVLVALKMPEPEFVKGVPYWDNLGRVIKDNRWVAFLVGSFLVGTAFMFITNFFYIFLKDLGAPSSLTGISVAASTILEIPFFIYSSALIKKVSARGLIIFSFFIIILRLLLTSLLKNPYWGIAVNMLHGPFYSTYWAGAVNYAREIAPHGLGASAQALFAASFFGLGGIVGSLLGGWLFTHFGPPVMFQTGAGLTLLGLIIFFWLGKDSARTPLN
jgi:PPP family 3-phenylpropionic acid transporter